MTTAAQELSAIRERLAKLETREQTLSGNQKEIMAKLDSLILRFDRYEAKWGTLFMIFSAISALVLAFKREIMGFFNVGR